VLARGSESRLHGEEEQRADGPNVFFRALPDYNGPWQYLQARRQAKAIARQAIEECDAYLLRVPGTVGQMVWCELRRTKKKYALQVVGDPWDTLGPGTWPNISRPFFRHIATQQLKRICAGAIAVNYVTSQYLQKRYPPSESAYSVGFSDVILDSRDVSTSILDQRYQRYRESPWTDLNVDTPFHIGFIGSLARLYKSADVLLRAVAGCRDRGLNSHLTMVGEGRHLPEMKTLAASLSIADRVEFRGELPSGASIFEFLDSIDLFVMPSRAEGLPRALVEAMSRGCPCIASAVGGIPELLEASDLVPAGSPEKLAKLILEVAADPDRLRSMSVCNLAKASEFTPQNLNKSRRAFLEEVKRRSYS
jgi:glycosyltransferase involved in cell wall biosynthesis